MIIPPGMLVHPQAELTDNVADKELEKFLELLGFLRIWVYNIWKHIKYRIVPQKFIFSNSALKPLLTKLAFLSSTAACNYQIILKSIIT